MGRFSRLGPKTPGADPAYLSSYESRSGGELGATEYWGPQGWDLEKSQKLAEYRKKYGPAFENKIAEEWVKMGWGPGTTRLSVPPFTGYTNMAKVQDKILIDLQNEERAEEGATEAKKNWQLRAAHQMANVGGQLKPYIQNNPMLY